MAVDAAPPGGWSTSALRPTVRRPPSPTSTRWRTSRRARDLARRPAGGARPRRERSLRRAQTVITAAAAAGVRHARRGDQRHDVRRVGGQPGAAAGGRAAAGRAGRGPGRRPDGRRAGRWPWPARSTLGSTITVVRPAALVGAGVDTVTTRHFEAPRLLTVRGADAGLAVLPRRRPGLGRRRRRSRRASARSSPSPPRAHLTQERASSRSAACATSQLSLGAALGTADRLHRVGVLPAPASDLAFAVLPVGGVLADPAGGGLVAGRTTTRPASVSSWTASGATTRSAARRVDRKDAALGAASAAVALVGTAAIMRRRRRNGGGA